MTVRRGDTGDVILEGACTVEDAEPLLQQLLANPTSAVDWTACSQLHTSVIQIILASGARQTGACGDAWVRRWLAPELPQKGTP